MTDIQKTMIRRRNHGISYRIKRNGCLAATGATIALVAHGIGKQIPVAAKQGFNDGRQEGHDCVAQLPYAVGAAVGFSFGVTEGVIGVLAKPGNALLSLGIRLGDWASRTIGRDCRPEGETEIAPDLA
jgi:hypothetical protein